MGKYKIEIDGKVTKKGMNTDNTYYIKITSISKNHQKAINNAHEMVRITKQKLYTLNNEDLKIEPKED